MRSDSPGGCSLVGISGAHIDRIGHIDSSLVMGASNPGRFHEMVGGGTINALRVASLCGLADAALVSVRGGDIPGETVAKAIADANL